MLIIGARDNEDNELKRKATKTKTESWQLAVVKKFRQVAK